MNIQPIYEFSIVSSIIFMAGTERRRVLNKKQFNLTSLLSEDGSNIPIQQ